MWLKAEKFFKQLPNSLDKENVKIHVVDDMYLSSNIWGEYNKRYTGIHGFYPNGWVIPNSGVNLDQREWALFMDIFPLVKDCLKGKKVEFGKYIPTEPAEDFSENGVKMFMAEWVVGDEVIDVGLEPIPTYSKEEAVWYAEQTKPVEGKDYTYADGKPDIRVRVVRNLAPEDTLIMKSVLLQCVAKEVLKESKFHCEACQVDSDSQFDHAKNGNCLDEDMDFVQLYGVRARNQLTPTRLMDVFSQVRAEIGLKPIHSLQLAKGALAWVPIEQIMIDLANVALLNTPLMSVIRRIALKE